MLSVWGFTDWIKAVPGSTWDFTVDVTNWWILEENLKEKHHMCTLDIDLGENLGAKLVGWVNAPSRSLISWRRILWNSKKLVVIFGPRFLIYFFCHLLMTHQYSLGFKELSKKSGFDLNRSFSGPMGPEGTEG